MPHHGGDMNKGFLVTTAIGLLLAGGGVGAAQTYPSHGGQIEAFRLVRAGYNSNGQGQPTDAENSDDTWDGPGYYLESPPSYASNGFRFAEMKFGGPFSSLPDCQQYHQSLEAAVGKKDNEHCIYRANPVQYARMPCFLTTACVEHAGLRDDCDELMLMRALRDRYLDKFGDGRAVIARYYEIAPHIVDCIRQAPQGHHVLTWILSEVRACAQLVAHGDMEAATVRYAAMVLRLEQRFGVRATQSVWAQAPE
ncbi:MAG: hypothetical protein KGO02_17155 [Alphaproteobacteria bacterium]|nr:hypothetical protein [Alphaproteobacteria bacterium]